ncbi:MAG: tyrosine-type recombinase/integrase, partial [Thermoproteota archaeon]
MAKETGARAGEIYELKWADIDFENGIVTIVPEKGGDPRAFRVSGKLIAMLNRLPRNGDKVFGHYGSLNSLRRCFERYRRRAADK